MRDYNKIYDKDKLERWYLVDHLTMEEIGKELGITRQAVLNRFRRCRIDVGTGERFKVKCDTCGNDYEITRKRWKSSIKHFCGHECYSKYLRNNDSRKSRNGQRIGRSVMEKHLNRDLMQGEVVHHIDFDEMNNDIKNLMIFDSNSDHIKYHHKIRMNR